MNKDQELFNKLVGVVQDLQIILDCASMGDCKFSPENVDSLQDTAIRLYKHTINYKKEGN